jgi:hypothetical protein
MDHKAGERSWFLWAKTKGRSHHALNVSTVAIHALRNPRRSDWQAKGLTLTRPARRPKTMG